MFVKLDVESITGRHWQEVRRHGHDDPNDSQRMMVESGREMAELAPQPLLQMIGNLTQIYVQKNLGLS